ncbi:MAG TPA: Fur family transcriptional regulator [Elusimicrobiota bacterium]|nr:Fur family transcriptional regulator [Elusimicrobiota bacterium]
MTKELVFFPSWTAGRHGYATRIREVFQKYLAEHGLRLTHQRQKIVDYLLAAEDHVTQSDVYRALKDGGIGKVTVFRTLKMLEECQLVERVTPPKGLPKFEIKHERPHHDHLVCVECGRIREVRWPAVERIQEKTCKALRFAPLWHRHEIFGLCQDCRNRRSQPA